MRIVLTPNEKEEKESLVEQSSLFYRFAFKYYEGSGNIHIIKTDIISQIYETNNGDVIVGYEDNGRDIVKDYSIATIEAIN